jgi:hypothetical protein
MGKEKDTGWGACFVSNQFDAGMEIVHNFVKMHGTPRASLEIDESVTIQTICMQAAVKATGSGE